MTMSDGLNALSRRLQAALFRPASIFLNDVGHGLLELSHNSLALLGLLLVGIIVLTLGRPDLRHDMESRAYGWLQMRHEAALPAAEEVPFSEPDAVARATAIDPRDLNRQQASVAAWLSRRYRVAPEPVSRLVQAAWEVGTRDKVDPTLILAIMAVESSFNPFAQSAVGAQGLMQVMTKVHDAKYEAFGGSHAAFDPVTNLRVGVQVLRECISRGGSIEAGLRFYVGAGNLAEDGGYAGKVLAEQNTLKLVASGRSVSSSAAMVTVSLPRAKVVVPSVAVDQAPAPEPASPEAPTAALPEKVALLH